MKIKYPVAHSWGFQWSIL